MAGSQSGIMLSQEQDGYLFSVLRSQNEIKKRKGSWRISFLSEAAGRPLIVPPRARMKEYCGEQGEFLYTQPVKPAMFTSREYQFFVPHKLFSWVEQGRRMLLRVERLDENNEEIASFSEELFMSAAGNMMRFCDENYTAYLVSFGTPSEKYSFISLFLETPGASNCGPVIEMLTGLSKTETDGRAEYELYRLYSDPVRAEGDETLAREWLSAAAQKGHEEAGRLLGLEQTAQELVGSPVAECLKLAESGNNAAQYKIYQHYIERGDEFDPAKALNWLTMSAENGNDEAIEKLSDYYKNSYLVDAGSEGFIESCKKSVEAGGITACRALFEAYGSGRCVGRRVKRDKKLALGYLKMAADKGDADACYRMWHSYEDGNDLLIEDAEAVKYLSSAAKSENPNAINELGELYVTGRVVNKDGENGIAMIKRAAGLGSFLAQMRVYRMTKEGRYYDNLLDVDKKGAQELLFDYAKNKGNPMAQTELWKLYLAGNAIMLTRPEALGFLKSAAKSDYKPAMFMLANILVDGVYQDTDTAGAKQLLEKGAKHGCSDAQLALYKLYYNGSYGALNCPINKERAYKFISEAAADGNRVAQYRMWEMYRSGNEMGLDDFEANDKLFSSVRSGFPDAMYAAAELFASGNGVPVDAVKAVGYLTRAAECGHSRSMYRLYEVYTSGAIGTQSVPQNAELGVRMLLLAAELGLGEAAAEVCRLYESGSSLGVDKTFVAECKKRLGASAAVRDEHQKTSEKKLNKLPVNVENAEGGEQVIAEYVPALV